MIGCDDMDRTNSPEIINKKLSVYLSNFTENDLEEYEEAIFTNKMSKRTRAELELDRIKNDLLRKPNEFADYFTEIARLTRLLKVAEFDSTVLDEVYSSIVRMQLECNSNIRLYSGISLLKNEVTKKYEYPERRR